MKLPEPLSRLAHYHFICSLVGSFNHIDNRWHGYVSLCRLAARYSSDGTRSVGLLQDHFTAMAELGVEGGKGSVQATDCLHPVAIGVTRQRLHGIQDGFDAFHILEHGFIELEPLQLGFFHAGIIQQRGIAVARRADAVNQGLQPGCCSISSSKPSWPLFDHVHLQIAEADFLVVQLACYQQAHGLVGFGGAVPFLCSL